MLEADEVDIDYFTPAASTSLAKIFNNDAKLEDDDASLKYVPKSSQNPTQNYEDSKTTKIIHACVFYGYEWLNNAYIARGKLGAAILKTIKTEQYSILLYDSNKDTLSCTNITTNFEVVMKEKTNISFYDNLQKYWSVYGTEADISMFVDKLISLNVSIKNLTNTETDSTEIKSAEAQGISNKNIAEKESDTDSSINKKTKNSILKRMATMGHSVLPIQTANFKSIEDSSDSDASTQKIVRHKPPKTNQKHTIDLVDGSYKDINFKKISQLPDNISRNSYDHQLVPIKSTNIINNPVINNSNELSLFMSEQRIHNSEMRINVNRISDKIDKILDSVHRSDQQSNVVTTGFQNNIIQKLLNEYENKIKTYENYFNFKGIDCNNIFKTSQEDGTLKDEVFHANKIQELEDIIENQKLELIKAHNEITTLQEKCDVFLKNIEDCDNHKKEICTLREELSEIKETSSSQYVNNLETKLKLIMNKTFHSLSANFNSNESYTGSAVKTLIANIIKKETMEALNNV